MNKGNSPMNNGRRLVDFWSGFKPGLLCVQMVQGIMALIVCLFLCGNIVAATSDDSRPDEWAQPVELEGVPNLHKVSDDLYRSAQPTARGMVNLKKMGIQTVINLRSFHSDRDEIADTGLAYEHIYMKAWHPEEKEIIRFLQIATNPKRSPVLVHCLHGADRTGTMCALYRIVVQGWTKKDAISEMTDGGFNFHGIFENLTEWISALDVEAIRKSAGIYIEPNFPAGKKTEKVPSP